MGLEGPGTSEADLDEAAVSRETLADHIRELVDAKLDAKQQEHGDEVWSQVERVVLLRTIDSLWVEHLTEVDDMRRGIGLRGYAQQDPLNAFRKEAFTPLPGASRPDPPAGSHLDLPRDRDSPADASA